MPLIPVITYTAPDGELRYGNHPPPRCADIVEAERACREPLRALRGMRGVRVAVIDDVTSRPVLLFRVR
jgi:hypothetical protein